MASANESPRPTARRGLSEADQAGGRVTSESIVANEGPQPVLIGEFQANSRETARVTLETFRGHDLFRIHKWFVADDGESRPGKGGISVNVRHLPRLAELIGAALERARVLGLIDAGEG